MARSPNRAAASPTVDRLRADIDSGRTGDKRPARDPAAAPLGTDDEAGGAPPTLDEIRDARRREIARRDALDEGAMRHDNRGFIVVGLLAAVAIVAAIAAVLGMP